MAGLNTRFHDVGFDIPKYLLPWGDETIIHEIIKQLGTFDETILLANKRDSYFKTKLVNTIAPLGLTENNIQYNADTLLTGRDFNEIESLMADGYIDVFVANNPKYSYVRSKDGLVTEIVEKSPISPFASSGLYGFQSPQLYQQMYESLSATFVGKEMYIANLFTHMIEKNCSIGLNDLNNKYETIVLGSPQEYGLELAKKSLR
jgi:NDP-sugar pyrophosphorylase family protein